MPCLGNRRVEDIWRNPEVWANLVGLRVGGGGKRKGTEGIGVSHQATYLDDYGGILRRGLS